jgi:hypothetical protein
MRPPYSDEERSRRIWLFAPLRIFFADDRVIQSSGADSMKNIPERAETKISVAERRCLSSGCVLITLKATEKSPAFSLSKGK